MTQETNAKALETLKEEGMEVTELPPEEIAKLNEKAKPVIEKHTQNVGADFVAEVYAEIEKVRGKK